MNQECVMKCIKYWVLVILMPMYCFSQNEIEIEAPKFSIELGYTPVIPLKTLKNHINDYRNGFFISGFRRIKDQHNLWIGLGAHFWQLDGYTNQYIEIGDFENFDIDATTNSSNLNISAKIRYFTDWYSSRLEPFFEASIGGHYLFTKTGEYVNDSDTSEVSFDENDITVSFSAGLGLQINVDENFAVLLTVNYVGGGVASYNTLISKESEVPLENYKLRTTQIEYLLSQIGVTFGF